MKKILLYIVGFGLGIGNALTILYLLVKILVQGYVKLVEHNYFILYTEIVICSISLILQIALLQHFLGVIKHAYGNRGENDATIPEQGRLQTIHTATEPVR